MGARVGELIGPGAGRRHGRRGGEGRPGAADGGERLAAGLGAELIEPGGRKVDRRSAAGRRKLDRLGIDELDEIPLARFEAGDDPAAVGGVDDLLAVGEAMLLGEHEPVRAIDVDGGRGGVEGRLPGEIEEPEAVAAS